MLALACVRQTEEDFKENRGKNKEQKMKELGGREAWQRDGGRSTTGTSAHASLPPQRFSGLAH